MEELYFLNRERFQKGDAKKGLHFALEIMKKNQDVDTITFLVYQQMHYDDFLGELGFSKDAYKNHGWDEGDLRVQIHTVKTYSPKLYFAGEKKRELLIAVGVPPQYLLSFVDQSRVKYWIIVPWLKSENEEFLKLFGAVDLETKECVTGVYHVDDRVKDAINWLLDTSYPNEGYHHPNDQERLKSVANAISDAGIPVDFNSIVHYCMNHGFLYSAAELTADYFCRAQRRRFSVTTKWYSL